MIWWFLHIWKIGNKKHIKSTSKYVGVHWHKRDRVFSARIFINNKSKHLGNFLNEIDAHNAYQKELQKINNNTLGN